jgi:hypothetical protein
MLGSGSIAPPFLTSAVDGGEWSAHVPAVLAARKEPPCTLCIVGWVGPIAGLDAVEYRTISCTCRKRNPGCAAHSPWKLF